MSAAGGLAEAVRALPVAGDGPPVTIPRDPAREAAKRELSKRMYHEHEPSLFQRALNRFWEWVQDLFDSASGAVPGGGIGLLVVALAVLALAVLLWWRLSAPRGTSAAAAPLFNDRPRTAAQHRAAAETHAAHGHWNQAVQERVRAIVRSLEERALLDPRAGRTADEAAAEAALFLPSHGSRLRAAAREFDEVTYGGRSTGEAAYRRLTALDRELEGTRPALTAAHSGDSSRGTPPGTAV